MALTMCKDFSIFNGSPGSELVGYNIVGPEEHPDNFLLQNSEANRLLVPYLNGCFSIFLAIVSKACFFSFHVGCFSERTT